MSSLNDPFVPELQNVLTRTEGVTLEATKALKGKGIDNEVLHFEADVKRKIAETRARLNQVKNAPGTAPGQGATPVQGALPAPVQGALPAPVQGATSRTASTTSSATNTVPLGYSSSDKLNLLRILNESLINTIKQVIEQMGTANTDFIRRALGYIQILLIQLQNLVSVFNRLDKRMGNIEKHLGMGSNTSTNTSQPDLEALRKQLEEVMRLAPTAPPPAPVVAPAPKGILGRLFASTTQKGGKTKANGRRKTRACKRKTRGMPRRRKNPLAKTRRRNTKSRR